MPKLEIKANYPIFVSGKRGRNGFYTLLLSPSVDPEPALCADCRVLPEAGKQIFVPVSSSLFDIVGMAGSNFVDYVKIYCCSGKGGAGSSHFRRAKYIPKGGPDGGDGGRGGHVYLRGNRNLWTLLHLRYERHIIATSGDGGSAKGSTGKDGTDRYIEVPCGTVLYDADTGEFLCDVTEDEQVVRLLKGGKGGWGNTHFKTSTNQADRKSVV